METRAYNTSNDRYLSREQKDAIRQLWRTHSDRMIADAIGICRETVGRYRRRNGLIRETIYPEINRRHHTPRPRKKPEDTAMTQLLAAKWR